MKWYYVTSAIGAIGLIGIAIWNRAQRNSITVDDVSGFYNSNNKLKFRKYTDVTASLSPKTVVYPGDPNFTLETLCHIGKDSCFGLSKISMSNHMGTHIDFPSHVVKEGKTSSDYDISDLIGEGIVIEIPPDAKSITPAHIKPQKINKNSFVFFKTSNSKISKSDTFVSDYVYIEPETAAELLKLQVRLVGIDYLSVDGIKNDTLPVHQLLLKNNILIVENLELSSVNPGKCIIHVSPLNVPDMDGLPARVTIER